MSANVDERIVQMQFDNQQFEAKAQNTITTLNALSQALQLPTANTKGLDEIQTSANRINFAKLNQAIDTVNYRFSTLGIMATNVLNRISNAAITTGKNLVESVTSKPIKDGFSEYELKMESVKRILNSAKNEDGTAVSLGQVNAKLDELNRYADKTIYSFSDMTSNIGKFTNAGVDLDKSVAAIQGIANEAALAGANSQEASRAMYNFAQALSSGYVKLIDWKSIENANMATVGFKEQLLKTAVALGTVVKEGDKYRTVTKDANGHVSDLFDATQGFNEALSNQWMTSEVLTETLAKYANETIDIGKAAFQAATEVTTFSKMIDALKESLGSGWAESWQLIIGDFGEAKQMWTAVNNVLSDIINNSAESRNKLLEDWRALGGREALIQGLSEAWNGLLNIVRNVYWAFQQVFPALDGFDLTRFSANFRTLMQHFREFTGRYGVQISFVAKGIASAFSLLVQVASAVGRTIAPIFGPLGEVFDLIFRKAGLAGRSFSDFVAHLKETDAIYNTLQKFVGILQKVAGVALNAAAAVLRFFGVDIQVEEGAGFVASIAAVFEAFSKNKYVQGGIDLLGRARTAITDFIAGLQNSERFQKFSEGLGRLGEGLAKIGSAAKGAVLKAVEGIGKAIRTLLGFGENVNLGGLDKLFDIGGLAVIAAAIKKLFDALSEFGKPGSGNPIASFKDFLEKIKNVKDIFKQAAEGLSNFASSITAPLKELTTAIKAEVLIKIAKAIAILAASVFVLSTIEPEKMGVALFGIAALMTELTGAMTAMSKLLTSSDASKFDKIGGSLTSFAIAIGILSLAVAKLSTIDAESLRNGVIAVGALMALMTIMTKLNSSGFNSKGMIAMSIAILILQVAVRRLAEVDADSLANGVIAVGILMALMTAMSKLGGKNFSGAGMVAVSVAILLLQKAVRTFGEMDLTVLAKGVGAVSALLIFMGLFSRISGKGALTASIGTIALAVAMGMLQKVVAGFGAMDTNALGNGLLALAASLAAMGIALNLMKGTLGGAAALVVATLALKMLVPVVQALAALPFGEVLKGVASLALIFGVLIVAGGALGAVVPALLAFSGAVLLVGIGVAALGVGLLAAAAGVAGLAGSLVASAASIIATVKMVVAGVIELIPLIFVTILKGFIDVLRAIGNSAETIVKVIVQVGVALINGLRELLGPLGSFIIEALAFVMQLLTDNMPALTNAFVEMVITLIDGIAVAIYNNTDRLMAAVHHVVGAIIDFVLATLQEFLAQIPGVGGKISRSIQDIRDDIGKTMNSEEGRKFGASVTDGMEEGIRSGKDNVEAAGTEVGEAAQAGLKFGSSGTVDWLQHEWRQRLPEGIRDSAGDVSDASSFLSEEAVNSAMEGFGDTESLGAYLPEGMADGILNNSYLTDDAASQMVQGFFEQANAEAEINSPSKKTWDMGMYLDEGLANGVTDNQGLISTAITGLGSIFTNGFQSLTSIFANAGSHGGTAYAQGLSRGVAPARSAGSSVVGSAVSAIASVLPRFGQNGTESGNAYVAGVTNKSGDARIAGSLIGSSAVVGLGTARPAFTITGAASGTNYSSGVSSKTAAAKSAGAKIGTSAANGARNYSGFYSAGGDSSQGYLDGLLSKAKKIATAAADMVKNALSAARNAIDSHSPSRAYEQLGDDSDQGYINGVNKKASKVRSTLSTLATSAMNAFYEGLSRANDAANDELTITPTVSPVMDMNNIYGGVDFLRDVFNGAGNVLGNITADVSNNIEDIHALVNNTNKILSSLQGRKPITLDGKTIIGWVDTELGAL